jgi:ankyrin repeat protein
MNDLDGAGHSALHLAVSQGNFTLARLLVDAGARVDVAASDTGMTPAMVLASLRRAPTQTEKKAEAALRENQRYGHYHRQQQQQQPDEKARALAAVALAIAVDEFEADKLDLIKSRMLDHDLNVRDKQGRTLLFHCLGASTPSAIEHLLAGVFAHAKTTGKPLDLNARDQSGYTLLMLASMALPHGGSLPLVRSILAFAAKQGNLGEYALDLSIVAKNGDTLASGIIEATTGASSSPAHALTLLQALTLGSTFRLDREPLVTRVRRRKSAPALAPGAPALALDANDAEHNFGIVDNPAHYRIEHQSILALILARYGLFCSATRRLSSDAPMTAADQCGAFLKLIEFALDQFAATPSVLHGVLAQKDAAHGRCFFAQILAFAKSFDVIPFVTLLVSRLEPAKFQKLAIKVDDSGCTPFLSMLRASFPLASVGNGVAYALTEGRLCALADFFLTHVPDAARQTIAAQKVKVDAKTGKPVVPAVVQKDLGQTALHIAAFYGATQFVGQLMLRAEQVDVMARDAHQRIPLHIAAAKLDAPLVTALLRVHPNEQLLAQDDTGAHALILCTRGSTKTQLPDLLLQAGVPGEQVALTDAYKRTALHYAVAYSARCQGNEAARDYELAFAVEKVLLTHGAGMNAVDGETRVPLHYVFVPLDAPYSTQTKGQSRDPIELVSDICAASAGTKDGAAFLHKASLATTIHVDVADVYGRTPLMYAAMMGAQICCKYLVQRGASTEAVDVEGNGMFQHALAYSQQSLAVDLVERADLARPIFAYTHQHERARQAAEARHEIGVAQEYAAKVAHGKLETISTFAHVLSHGWIGLAYLMMDQGVSICMAVQDALQHNLLSLVSKLLSKTAPNKLLEKDPETGRSLLHLVRGGSNR